MVVTALGDGQIGVVARRRQDAARLVGGGVDVAVLLHDPAQEHPGCGGGNVIVAARAEDAVHLGHLLQNFVLVALGQAAGDQNFSQPALLLQLRHLEDVGNGLLLGRVDEAAGVDNDQIRAVRLAGDPVTGLLKPEEHLLRIDLVFGAAE